MQVITNFFSQVSLPMLTVIVMLDAFGMLMIPFSTSMTHSLAVWFMRKHGNSMRHDKVAFMLPLVLGLPALVLSASIIAIVLYATNWQTLVAMFLMWFVYGPFIAVIGKEYALSQAEKLFARMSQVTA